MTPNIPTPIKKIYEFKYPSIYY